MGEIKAYSVFINNVKLNTIYSVQNKRDIMKKLKVGAYEPIGNIGLCGVRYSECTKNKLGYYKCGKSHKCASVQRYNTTIGIVDIQEI